MTGVAIGIDLGTSGLRAALVDAQPELLSLAQASIAPAQRRVPAAWWDATRAAVRDLGADLRAVRAIAVDGTSGTILPVDAAGNPLALASLYDESADPATVVQVAAAAPADSAARGHTSPGCWPGAPCPASHACCTKRIGWPANSAASTAPATGTMR
jgi:sugar (pentulose or hexulose) kinase